MSKLILCTIFISLYFFNTEVTRAQIDPQTDTLENKLQNSDSAKLSLPLTVTVETKDSTIKNGAVSKLPHDSISGLKKQISNAIKIITVEIKRDTAQSDNILKRKLALDTLNSRKHLVTKTKDVYLTNLSAFKKQIPENDSASYWQCDTVFIWNGRDGGEKLVFKFENFPIYAYPPDTSSEEIPGQSPGPEGNSRTLPPKTKTLSEDLNTFIKDHAFFFIIVCILFALLLLTSVWYLLTFFRSEKSIDIISEKNPKENKPIITEEKNVSQGDKLIESLAEKPSAKPEITAGEPQNVKAALSLMEKAVEQLKTLSTAHPEPTFQPINKNSFFSCEILMTAGPRKKINTDKDLGEDVCGFVSNAEETLLWLLDGTSDLHCLKNPENNREYFSSRLLAQGIANKLRQAFLSKNNKPLNEIMADAISDLKKDWMRVINSLPLQEKAVLITNIENKNLPESAATMLTARLKINGDFVGYRSGDSKMLLFSSANGEYKPVETKLAEKNEDSNDRIFFRLILDVKGNFDIQSNEPKFEIIKQQHVTTVISFSDGIGGLTEKILKEGYKNNPEKIRKEIIYQSQGTADDKSISFVEIKEINEKP